MKLYLLRHAKSDWSKPIQDIDRPLNERGKREALALGSELERLELVPDLILLSSSKRTQETLKYLAAGYERDLKGEVLDDLYLASATCLKDMVEDHPSKSLMIIAHNPGIERCASELLGDDVEMKTAHLLLIDTDSGALEQDLRGKDLL